MKILFVSSWFPLPADTGGKVRILNLLRHLAARHRVTFLSFARPGPATASQVRELATICDVKEPVPFPKPLPHPVGWFRNARWHSDAMRALIQSSLLDGPIDFVVAAEVLAGFYAAEAKGIPRLLDNCELTVMFERWTKAEGFGARLKGRSEWSRKSRFTGNLAQKFDVCTVVSELERDRLIDAGVPRKKVLVVSNGVDLATHQPDWGPPEAETIIFPGALTFHANLDAMQFFTTEIWPRIRRQRPNVRLRITGEFHEIHRHQLGISGDAGVELTGRLPDVRPVVGRSAVCAVPLRVGGGTRVKIIEAMALGTPVVTTSKGAEGLPVEHGRQLLIANDAEAFTRAVCRLFDDVNLREELVSNALELVRRQFDWSAAFQPIDQFLKGIGQSR